MNPVMPAPITAASRSVEAKATNLNAVGQLAPAFGSRQEAADEARFVQQTHQEYKKGRRWQGVMGALLAVFGINVVGDVNNTIQGEPGNLFGAEVPAPVEGGLDLVAGLYAASELRNQRRRKNAAQATLNDLGYVVVGREMIPVLSREKTPVADSPNQAVVDALTQPDEKTSPAPESSDDASSARRPLL